MTEIANTDQHAAWNGDSGHRWVADAERRDRVLSPIADAVLATADLRSGEAVLDIGCGCGATSLAAATAVAPGEVCGIDLSAPMLEVARTRADDQGVANVTFLLGDAQSHALPTDRFGVAISRFGTMFFADPVAAFTNVATALRPGGRLCLATWQTLTANEWLVVPGAALLRHTDLPATSTDGPGMFAQSDPGAVTDTLSAAGLTEIQLEPVEVTFTLGSTTDVAVDYLADSGPGRLLLETIPEGTARDAALADVSDALADHTHDGHIRLGGGIWLITATRPVG